MLINTETDAATNTSATPAIRIIKKYPNRRLYDTDLSQYITLNEIRSLIINQEEFKIIDSKTQNDITHQVLMQIVQEQELLTKSHIFSISFLRELIRAYGTDMQTLLTTYFSESLNLLLQQRQEALTANAKPPSPEAPSAATDTNDNLHLLTEKNLAVWKRSWDNLRRKK